MVMLQAAHKDPAPSPSSSTDENCELWEFTGTPSQASQSSESSKENENPQKSEKKPKHSNTSIKEILKEMYHEG